MYGCPGCGSQMTFDIATQQLKCGRCDRTMGIAEADEREARQANNRIAMDRYSCPVCGAEIHAMNTAAAAFCSYCGSSVMLNREDAEIDPPETVAPFRITREQCFEKYRQVLNKSFCVDHRLKKNITAESFRGIYVPYHTYRAAVQGKATLKATKTSGNTTYYYDTIVELNHRYEGILHDASREVPDNISERISRTSRSEFVPFSPAYLSGYYADVSDTDPEVYIPYAQSEAIRNGLDDTIKDLPSGLHYSTGDTQHKLMHMAQAEYTGETLMPMWFMSMKSGKRVLYAVQNGVTGEMWADKPMDIPRFGLLTLILAAALFGVLCLLPNPLRPEMVMIMAMLLGIGAQVAVNARRRKVYEREVLGEVPEIGQYDVTGQLSKMAGLRKQALKQGRNVFTRNIGAIGAAIAIVLGLTIISGLEDIRIYKVASVGLAVGMGVVTFTAFGRRSKLPPGSILAFAAIAAGATILVLDPFHSSDFAIYAVTACILAAVIWESLDLIRTHNKGCSNPMPQFGTHQGGENI